MGSGLYGFNKNIQSDIDVCIRKLTRKANSLATALEVKYPEAGSFFKDRMTRTNDPACEAMSNACRLFRDRPRILPGVAGYSQGCVKACMGAISTLQVLAGEIGNVVYKKDSNHLDYMNAHYGESKCPFTKLLIDAFPIYTMLKTSSTNRSAEMKNYYRFSRFNQRQASDWMADENMTADEEFGCGGRYADEQYSDLYADEDDEEVAEEYQEAEDFYDEEDLEIYYDGVEEGYDMGYNDALQNNEYDNGLDEELESDDDYDQVIYDDGFEDGYDKGYKDAVQGLEYDNGFEYEDEDEDDDEDYDDEDYDDEDYDDEGMFASEAFAHSLIDEFDLNDDDLISMEEWQGSMAVFLALDTDGDGFISRQEIEDGLGSGHGFGFNKVAARGGARPGTGPKINPNSKRQKRLKAKAEKAKANPDRVETRGGSRPGAGAKTNPNSKRQQKLRAKAEKAQADTARTPEPASSGGGGRCFRSGPATGKGKGHKECYHKGGGGMEPPPKEPGASQHQYQLHNDYGSANSANRKEYNRKYYSGEFEDLKQRSICPGGSGNQGFKCGERSSRTKAGRRKNNKAYRSGASYKKWYEGYKERKNQLARARYKANKK